MAGYLFSLGKKDEKSLINCIRKGVYSTIIKVPTKGWNGSWNAPQEGTFADYASMKQGDNVYFFMDRKIYGIGELVNINECCVFLNYPGSNIPEEIKYSKVKKSLLVDFGKTSIQNRFICTFRPLPVFFKNGIDMDDALSSAPAKFKMLRAFWKLSFIKFSDDENQAFKDIILRRNIDFINLRRSKQEYKSNFQQVHHSIKEKINGTDIYDFDIAPLLSTIEKVNGSLRHEKAVEASIIYQLSRSYPKTKKIFGSWDYLSHQVIASPFKPIDYMDKMDIFGYKYVENLSPTISNYLVIEIKRDKVQPKDILQLMKYVDWINNEYAHGDYGMIKAFIIGHSFSQKAVESFKKAALRKYIKVVRPSSSEEWHNVKLVKYQYNRIDKILDFTDITPNE